MKKIRYPRVFAGTRLFRRIITVALMLAFSCNDPMSRLLTDEYKQEPGSAYENGRVLFIVVDGLCGKAMNQAINYRYAENTTELLDHSMYSFVSLSESSNTVIETTAERAWANLFTGVTAGSHGVKGSNLEDLQVPSFLQLLKEADVSLTSSFFSANEAVFNAFSDGTDRARLLTDDKTVRDEVVNELSGTETTDVVLAEFGGVYEAGLVHGFYDPDNGDTHLPILEAIQVIDGYMGEIMEALQARPNYTQENWLVIITSNYAGEFDTTSDDPYADKTRNTFTLLHSPRFASKMLLQPQSGDINYTTYSPLFTYQTNNWVTATVKDSSLFDMGTYPEDARSYTIQFFVNNTLGQSSGESGLLSKRGTHANSRTPEGWNICTNGSQWRFYCSGTNDTRMSISTSVFTDRNFHVLTVVFDKPAGVVRFYTDGIPFNRTTAIQSGRSLSNSFPLKIGSITGNSGTNQTMLITNIQLYNVALPAEFIAANSCRTEIHEIEDFEYWDNLIGYWPGDLEEDFEQPVLRDYSQYAEEREGQSDMVLRGDAIWTSSSKYEANVCPDRDITYYRGVFNSVDLSYEVFQWLGAGIKMNWGLEGRGWTPEYTLLQEE